MASQSHYRQDDLDVESANLVRQTNQLFAVLQEDISGVQPWRQGSETLRASHNAYNRLLKLFNKSEDEPIFTRKWQEQTNAPHGRTGSELMARLHVLIEQLTLLEAGTQD
jgi:hypothetical protein